MTTITTIRTAIFAALVAILFSGSALAASASGTTNVTVNVPEFIILHYYSAITLSFDTPSAEAVSEGSSSANVDWNGSVSNAGELGAANLMNASLELDGKNTTVTLPNVWAVRGFSASGTAKVEISVPAGKNTMTLNDSEIAISNLKVGDGSSSGSSITTRLNGISRSRASFGSIEMDLDFSNTSRSGLHSGAQYTITATTI
jgi:hypothetical protein